MTFDSNQHLDTAVEYSRSYRRFRSLFRPCTMLLATGSPIQRWYIVQGIPFVLTLLFKY
jgi:hypothetical protein